MMNLQEDLDTANRCSDAVNLHLQAAIAQGDIMGAVHKWIAVKLSDGSSDGNLYDTKDDALKHVTGDPKHWCYIQIPPDGMSVKDAMHFLKISRHPMIDTTAPPPIQHSQMFPRFSNLSAAQKRKAQLAEDKIREANR